MEERIFSYVRQHLFLVVTGRYQSGQLGQTVNLLSYDFAGSNPALPTPRHFMRAYHFYEMVSLALAGVAQLVER